jgi:hypothetical protein
MIKTLARPVFWAQWVGWLLCLAGGAALAQSSSRLDGVARGFAQACHQARNRADAEKAAEYLAQEATVSYSQMALNGQKRSESGDWRVLVKMLERTFRDTGQVVKYDYRGVRLDDQLGNWGIVSYQADYEIFKGGLLAAKGTETVILTCRQADGSWVVTDVHSVSIEAERYRGACACEVFTSDPASFSSKTQAPNGKSYQTYLSEFGFTECDRASQTFLVKTDSNVYRWHINGEVHQLASEADCNQAPSVLFLGLATNRPDVVRLIVEKHLLQEHCSTVSLKK